MTHSKNKIRGIIWSLLMIVSVVLTSTPKFAEGKYTIIAGILATICIFANWNAKVLHKNSTLVLRVFLYIVLIFTYKLLGISSAEWGGYMEHYFFCATILLMLLIPNKFTYKQAQWVWWIMIAVFVFNVGYNIYISILYPQIHLMASSLNADFFKSINAGGSRFYNITLFFFMICFFVYLNSTKKLFKYVILGCAALTAVYICFYTLKASVVVFCLLSTVLLFYANITKKNSILICMYVAIGLLSVLFLKYYSDLFINYIIEFSPEKRLSSRLIALVDNSHEDASDVSLVGRKELWFVSIKTWLDNPINFIFGIGDHRASDVFDIARVGIGQHSDFLDTLARYGLIGGYLIFIILKKAFIFLLTLFGNQYRLHLMVIFLVFILVGFTKAIFISGVATNMFLMLPLFAKLINSKQ